MRQRWLNLAVLVANSSLGFAFGTVVALELYNLGLVAAGVLYDRGPRWYPDRVEFTASGQEIAWFGGILLVLVLGWALASIYRGGTRYDGTRMAVLWVMLHCFRQGLMPLARLPFDANSDPSRALTAIDMPESLTWVVGVLGVAGLLGLGLFAAPALLRFAPEDPSTKQGRIAFIGLVGIAAWLVGAFLALPLLLPGGVSSALELLPWSGVFLVFTLVASPEPRVIYAVRESAQLSWGTLVFLGVFIAAVRVFLADGLAISL
ncbi:MAG: hypothetical protein OEM84_07685 [Acidimicrobiia bacterium]|nr:hypothetical protein [Acidimicrobiia bacterium]